MGETDIRDNTERRDKLKNIGKTWSTSAGILKKATDNVAMYAALWKNDWLKLLPKSDGERDIVCCFFKKNLPKSNVNRDDVHC